MALTPSDIKQRDYEIALKQAEMNRKRAYDDMMERMAKEGAAKASGQPIKPETPDALAGHYTRVGNPTTPTTSTTTPTTPTPTTSGGGNTSGGSRTTRTTTPAVAPTTTNDGGGGYSGGDGGGGGSAEYVNPYESALSLLEQNYNNAVKAVKNKYSMDTKKLRSDASDQLRQAYINYMLNKQNAANDMTRMGYTGGLTESNLARLYNNYGTIRNDINRRLDEAIDKYNVRKNNELLNLLTNYNNQKMRYSL